MESDLAQSEEVQVASLRSLLQRPASAAAISRSQSGSSYNHSDTAKWSMSKTLCPDIRAHFGELRATLSAQHKTAAGPSGRYLLKRSFLPRAGRISTIFVPCKGTVRAIGRVTPLVDARHCACPRSCTSSHANVDLAYGSSATYVTQHALAVEGPLREYYLVGPQDTPEESAWRTEIGWPIFHTG